MLLFIYDVIVYDVIVKVSKKALVFHTLSVGEPEFTA